MGTVWRVRLLGGLRVERNAEVTDRFRTRKTAELLAYLAYFRKRSHPREVLVDLLWPEADVEAGRHNLSMALSALRAVFESGDAASPLRADRFAVRLDPAQLSTDVAEFETALQDLPPAGPERAGRLEAALALYGGELLPGYYQDWVVPEQQRLDERYFAALRELTAALEAQGQPRAALDAALRCVAAHRLREEAHREVIRLHGVLGQREAALRQFRELERLLQEELDAAPGPETREALRGATADGGQWSVVSGQWGDRGPQSSVPGPPSAVVPEPAGGAVPLGSRFYVERPADRELREAVARQDSLVLLKGARQVGKTSLLARGLQQAREAGARVVFTHFQSFNAGELETADTLLRAIAEAMAEQLDLEELPAEAWEARRGPNQNFRRYLRRAVLPADRAPLLWGLDEVDALFSRPYSGEIFALFRSWHDERALEPAGPWRQLTLALAYSTEAHLFITDVNQSPFNVGTRLALADFTPAQVADLNARHGGPLRGEAELGRFHALLGGQPYLVRLGLYEMAVRGVDLAVLERRAAEDGWIFGEHLRRIASLLRRDPELCAVVRNVLRGSPCPTPESFYRLRSAGVLAGESSREARPRCGLYARYLKEL